MTVQSYDPDEPVKRSKGDERLLAEFAKAALTGLCIRRSEDLTRDDGRGLVVKASYDIAEQMLAEHKRRMGER